MLDNRWLNAACLDSVRSVDDADSVDEIECAKFALQTDSDDPNLNSLWRKNLQTAWETFVNEKSILWLLVKSFEMIPCALHERL